MGAGASRNRKQQDHGEDSSTEASSDKDDKKNQNHLLNNNIDKLTIMPSNFVSKINNHHHSIIDSDSNDDEEDTDNNSTSVQMTDRELEDLESSLMEIPSLKGISPYKKIESRIRNKQEAHSTTHPFEQNQDENGSILSTPPRTNGAQTNSFYEFARKRPKRTGDVRRTSSLGRSNQFTSNRRPYQRSVEDTQRLRFSWDERKTSSATAVTSLDMDRDDEDEWTYRKTVIDGFDVAKFKKVNSKVEETPFIEKHNGRNMFMDAQMPGVPTYDMMEQQLLASLEREIL
ncbi:uncharacterized protein [Lepeophtheirus salmonis]|uniref:Uncharacterized protein n=1 Tax=Lepeophtheirus salmonis TaxID=72036 RepID=A0A0K2TI25_LEPSM|nr:DNA topoisomerase 1-like isoform X2 [Lepeophtheirus salmonis]